LIKSKREAIGVLWIRSIKEAMHPCTGIKLICPDIR
jgi:hypothetical protein